MIKKNNQTIDKIYKGTTEIAKIYKGSTLVYENYRDIIATGNDIINITKAKANSLNYLKAFGKCEQIGLPVGYQQVEYIESTGTQYINTGFKPNPKTTRVETTFQVTDNTKINQRLFGARKNYSDVKTMCNIFWNSQQMVNAFRVDWVGSASIISSKFSLNTDITMICENNIVTINSVKYKSATDKSTTYLDSEFYINVFFDAGNTTSVQSPAYVKWKTFKIYDDGTLVRDFIPCKNAEGIVGLYDLVENKFYSNSGTGDFVAGTEIVPTPSTPIPIWCNNGELKVSPNLFDKNNLNYIAGYLTVNGNKIESSSKTDTYYIECNPNTTYTLQREKVKTSGQVFRFASYSEVPTYNNQFTGMVGGLTDDLTLTITTGANDKYLAFSIGNVLHSDTEYIDKVQIEQGSTATQYRPYRQIYTDGTTETIKDSLNNTATAENLLSAGTYKDVQEVISGSVTRNVGIKVLNGTEDWQYHSYGTNSYQLVFNLTAIPQDKVITCSTHFKSYSYDSRSNPATNMLYLHPSVGIVLRNSTFPTVDDFKQWLADQYANGTPVIVVYPLATPTTETVTAQPMNIQKGTNIIEVTEASLDDLELEAKYKGK